MKKKILVLLLFIISITLASCTTTEDPYVVDCEKFPTHADCIDEEPDPDPEPIECEDGYELVDDECELINTHDYLEIYYLNDFHGAITPDGDKIGLAYIANLINSKREQNPDNVLFVVGGDILQGSALSNYYLGLSTINILNTMGLDAFTVGNHEFDWGLDVIQDYADGDLENGEANFPFLGANIFLEGTEDLPEGIDPYTIVTKGDKKIGIIGTIGFGLERSIAEARVSPFDFGDPITQIEFYSHYLRTVENCDIVIVVSHDSGNINNQVAALEGDYRVDAVFNGHSHSDYAYTIDGMPVIQSGGYGKYVGYVKITLDPEGTTYDVDNLNKYQDAFLYEYDETAQALIDQYELETADLFTTPIITTGEYMSSGDLSRWMAGLMRHATNADIGFQNFGGTRTSIDDNHAITLASLYEVWPFDNIVKTVYLTGTEVNALIQSGLAYDTSIESFDPNEYYLVATNDYVFDKPTNPFLDGVDPVYTGILMRDLAQSELELQALIHSTFLLDNAYASTGSDYNIDENEITP